ncbi:Beta-glucuronosyltransferase GlcAT14B [Linum perenne]
METINSCISNGTNKLQQLQKKQQKWFLLLISSLLLSTLLILLTVTFSPTTSSSTHLLFHSYRRTWWHKSDGDQNSPRFVESKLLKPKASTTKVPRLAYLISGSAGDGVNLKRVLKALYHPRNQYVVHLDLEAPLDERLELIRWVNEEEKVFQQVGNVRVVVRSNLVTYRGPTMVTNTLHAASILLRDGGDWDWFINLSASDYPLLTQDDHLLFQVGSLTNIYFTHCLPSQGISTLLSILVTLVGRSKSCVSYVLQLKLHTYTVDQRARPVIIDPGLYSLQKSDVFWVTEKRSVPSAYRLFTGSAWMMLSRPFMEYCLWGWDNLPRIVLMYYANFLSSPEGYFHTVICNADEFRNTTVNHDLHFISWDNPPKQHPHFLTVDDYQRMVDSNAPFARKFGRNDVVLDKVDSEILGRSGDGFVPGGWWSSNEGNPIPENIKANTTELKPGPGAQRLKNLMTGLLSADGFQTSHCT